MELVKARAYNREGLFTKEEQDSALFTLQYCLDNLLKLLAPITPMITYKLYKDLRGKDIHLEAFPEKEIEAKPAIKTIELTTVNSVIWKAKKDKGLSLNAEITGTIIPEPLKAIEKDFVNAHKLKDYAYGKELKL